MKNKKIADIPAVPAVLFSIISVQGGAAIAKGIFPILGATSTSALRIVLAALILCLVNRPNVRNLSAAQWKTVALYGLTLGAMNVVFYMAIARIPLGLGVALEFIGPLVLALAGSKRLTDVLWAILAGAGIALIAPWHNNGLNVTGMLLALLAGVFWVGYILMGGRVSKMMDGGKAVTIGMFFASMVILPIAIGDGLITHLKPSLLLLGFALALLSSAIPFSLEMIALKKIPAKTFSVLMSLEPAAAAISGLIFLHEYLTLYEWLAIALIIIASVGATLSAKAKQAVAAEV
ncbi:EamA family transporter [Mucilaginibacter agri]|uniref:EamA family transporter n=1 Tax=Mucilaginibacter agri TaxID=2695265 RepID=A0A965ZIR1_9SPHI|nr:DMT family transporter [Mucilaginibacter agri]NCD70827.1 EamA family transporter [Mucilaginibacter agri]